MPRALSKVLWLQRFSRILPTSRSLFVSTYRDCVFWRIFSGLVGDDVDELQMEIAAFEPIDLAVVNLDLLFVWEAVATRNTVARAIVSGTRLYRTRVLHHSSLFINNITLNKRNCIHVKCHQK